MSSKNSKVLFIEIIFISILMPQMRLISVSKTFNCLYDECQCLNETNTFKNEISVICLSTNTKQASATQPDTNLQNVNIKTFQFYNYNLKSLPENLFANLTIEYLALDLKEVELLENNSLSSIKILTNLAIYHLNKFENDFLANNVANNLISLSIELSDLVSLDLIGNDISLCRNLNQLILSHNRLTSFVSGKILSDMKHIETLKLNNNQIETILFDIEIQSLKHLILSSNKIKFIDEKMFKNLKNLILIDLFENEIKSIEPHAFIHARSLLYLYLGNNYMMRLPSFECISRLKQLDIRNQHGFLMSISNSTFKFEITNNNQLNVYLDEYFMNHNITYDLYIKANRPIVFETFSFDLTLKNLETLFRSHLRKAKLPQIGQSNRNNKNYIIYRLLSQQTSSVFDINYFANNYLIDYDFQVENRVFLNRDRHECINTQYKGETIEKTLLFCENTMNSNASVTIKSQLSKAISKKNVSKNLKLKLENLNFMPNSSAKEQNLKLQKILVAISFLASFFLLVL